MAEHLRKRGNVYYVRVPVSKPLWSVVGRREFVRTTGTGDLHQAKTRRHALIAEIHREIKSLIDDDPASPSWLERQAIGLRKAVKRGEIDPELADDFIEIYRNRHLAANRQSTDSDLPASQMSRLQSVSRLVSDPDFEPLSALIKSYLDEKRPIVQPSTLASKGRTLSAFKEWLGDDPDINEVNRKLTGKFVSEVLAGNGRSPKTNRDTITVLSTFWNYAIRRGQYDHPNPWTGLAQTLNGSSRGSVTGQKRRWTDTELKALFQTIPAGPKYYLREMSAIALYTGARQGEIADLKVTDIDLEGATLSIREGKSQAAVRTVPIHSKLLPVIEKLIGKRTTGYLFDTLKSTGADKLRGHEPSKRFGYWRNKAFPDAVHKLPSGRRYSEVDFHSFRRSLINACELAGIPEPTTQQLVGHSKAGRLTYGTYSKGVNMELLREAIEKVDFPGVELGIDVDPEQRQSNA